VGRGSPAGGVDKGACHAHRRNPSGGEILPRGINQRSSRPLSRFQAQKEMGILRDNAGELRYEMTPDPIQDAKR